MSAALRLTVLGRLELVREGSPVELPQSRKTRALLAYLALVGRELPRDRLCELLWPDVADPRGALRWSLSKLRPLVSDEAKERLISSRDSISFDASDVEVDALFARRALGSDPAAASTEALKAAADAFKGDLLEGLEVPDAPDFHAWHIAQREELRRFERKLLDVLVERLKDVPDAALPYARRRAQRDRDDEGAQVRLIAVLSAGGHAKEADEHYRTYKRWLEGRGEKPGVAATTAWASIPRRGAATENPASAEDLHDTQEIRFCKSSDGTRIAWATAGRGPPLVKAANWLSHLEFEWESPIWAHWYRALTRDFTLVRYDARANGLSDWEVPEISFDAFGRDLDAVTEAAGFARYPLLGISQGAAVAVAHAIRHPERVSRLVLVGGFTRGWRSRPSWVDDHAGDALLTLMRHGWGQESPAFRQIFTSLFFPHAASEIARAFNELQRRTASPDNAVAILTANGEIDVRDLLPRVTVPTLVLHARRDALVPFSEGRALAATIPNARFVPLDSENHVPLEDEPAWPTFLSEVRAFLAEG